MIDWKKSWSVWFNALVILAGAAASIVGLLQGSGIPVAAAVVTGIGASTVFFRALSESGVDWKKSRSVWFNVLVIVGGAATTVIGFLQGQGVLVPAILASGISSLTVYLRSLPQDPPEPPETKRDVLVEVVPDTKKTGT